MSKNDRHDVSNKTLKWLGAFVVIEQLTLGWSPAADRFTWVMENFPVWIGLIVVALTHRRFPLSNLCLGLLVVHSLILAVGGHYTYAKVPLGDWARDTFHFSRNHYDRLGHFAQASCPLFSCAKFLSAGSDCAGSPSPFSP